MRRSKSKYRNVKVTVDGIKFDSKIEAKRYGELKLLERAGKIEDLTLQTKFKLIGQYAPLLTEKGRHMAYIADFTYWDVETEKRVIEDVKGMKTPIYLIKKAIMQAMGYEILEIFK